MNQPRPPRHTLARALTGLAFLLGASAGQAGLAQATTHVLAVGQNSLEKAIRIRETGGANPDIAAVANALRPLGAQVATLEAGAVTRDAVKAELARIGQAMKPQDSLIFYFSGFTTTAQGAPALLVQGSGENPGQLFDGSRILPMAELRQWLAATGAPALLMVVDGGPETPGFCAPWPEAGAPPSLTLVCASLPGKPDEAGPIARNLAAGLAGAADSNGDGQFSGDELAAYLRKQTPQGLVALHSGPVAQVTHRPAAALLDPVAGKAILQAAAALPSPKPGAGPGPLDKLDSTLRALAELSGNGKAVQDMLSREGMALRDGLIPVELDLADPGKLAEVRERVQSLGGALAAVAGYRLYVALPATALKPLTELPAVWSMSAARPMLRPMR